MGNLDVARDFSDVRDVVGAYAALLDGPVQGKLFNICSGKAVALRDVIAAMQALTVSMAVEIRVNLAPRGSEGVAPSAIGGY
ncbi:hypothetical protein [Thiomonas sp. X19]|uniref:hypothetical protein n=1 Tax=Thiomonas sp. X19 TaxID=1050370 RepID=UPI0011BFE1EC|nr:hypothetical protein [Thiomonas sp. X19]